jgi:hypothetical protein
VFQSFYTRSSLIIFLLALTANILWLSEICLVKGWAGLQWLNGTLYSPYLSTLLCVMSFTTPFLLSGTRFNTKFVFSAALLFLCSLFLYEAGHIINEIVYSRFSVFISATNRDLLVYTTLCLFPLLGFSYWLITDKLIRKNRETNLLLICIITALVIPLSLLTICLYSGFGSQTGWVDAVKMGYPVFWMTLLMGISGHICVKR